MRVKERSGAVVSRSLRGRVAAVRQKGCRRTRRAGS